VLFSLMIGPAAAVHLARRPATALLSASARSFVVTR
jgi:hypothetical protein